MDTKLKILSETCRMCASRDDNIQLYHIFGTINKEIFIKDIIKKYVNIEISETDECKTICEKCVSNIDLMHQLHENFQKGQLAFDLLMGCLEMNSVVKEEPIQSICPLDIIIKLEKIDASIYVGDGGDEINTPDYEEPTVQPTKPGNDDKIQDDLKKFFKCHICRRKFVDLKKHLLKHGKAHQCNVCYKKFTTRSALKSHSILHSGVKIYECELCNKWFAKNGYLQQHLKVHTYERPYKCEWCNKGFSQRGHLQYHTLIHTNERPHKCDVCGVGFRQPGHLRYHKLVHTNVKPYACDVCGAGFGKRMHLKAHYTVHTGEKPYECVECGMRFRQATHLRSHTKSQHRASG